MSLDQYYEVADVDTELNLNPRDRKKKQKQSLNHLLNFSYAENKQERIFRKKPTFQPYRREQFVLANFRFAVRPGLDYSLFHADPDRLVDWDDIELAIHSTHTPYACPICLEPPVAPKMTKCGHIFCYSCILHYLTYTDKNWIKCPMCSESISVNHPSLKSATVELQREYKAGARQTIRFVLMNRPKGSIVPSRQQAQEDGNSHVEDQQTSAEFPPYTDEDASKFSRCCTITDIRDIIKRETAELRASLAVAKSSADPETPFIEAALREVESRNRAWKEWAAKNIPKSKKLKEQQHQQSHQGRQQHQHQRQAPTPIAIPTQQQQQHKSTEVFTDPFASPRELQKEDGCSHSATAKEHLKTYFTEQFGGTAAAGGAYCDTAYSENNENDNATPTATQNHRPSSWRVASAHITPASSDSNFKFFQVDDGQLYFLHPLNFKMLLREYGSYANLPSGLEEAHILEVEKLHQTEKTRKMYRYLAHIPLGADFSFVEIDMTELVSAETMRQFGQDLKSRKIRRERQARQELREEIEQDRRNQEEIRRRKEEQAARIDLSNPNAFPTILEQQPEEEFPLPRPSSSSSSSTSTTTPTLHHHHHHLHHLHHEGGALATNGGAENCYSSNKRVVKGPWGNIIVVNADNRNTASVPKGPPREQAPTSNVVGGKKKKKKKGIVILSNSGGRRL